MSANDADYLKKRNLQQKIKNYSQLELFWNTLKKLLLFIKNPF